MANETYVANERANETYLAGNKAGTVSMIGGALAAFGAMLCCLGPLVLVTLGVGGAWISNLTALEPYRPVFIGAALVFMGFAWRRIYRAPAAEACAPGTVCGSPRANRLYKAIFWLVSGLVVIAVAYPYVLPLFY